MSQPDREYRLQGHARRPNRTRIDADLCNGCGLCVEDCPMQALSMVDGVAVATGETSMGCDHCAAICPTGAVTVGEVRPELTRLESLEVDDRWVPFGEYPAGELVRLMRSRRSCRHFTGQPVDEAVLRDLVRIGLSAPSGSNWQPWTFTILPDRATVLACGQGVLRYFKKLNELATRVVPRLVSRVVMKGDPLGMWAEQYRERVVEYIRDHEENGTDHLFHDAPAAIVIATREGSMPAADAMMAAQNILLAAHALGLGTCLVGFASSAMQREERIARDLGIPPGETVRAVIAVGHPAVRYERTTGRLDAPIRITRR